MGTLTMQDVADLAKVRRPVVSMWRKRPVVRGVSMPFPDATEVVAGVERFDAVAVTEWLERTGRGNNAGAALDVAAVAAPSGATVEDVLTLLCWQVLTGADLGGTTWDERVAAARAFDPDDTLLLREMQGLRPDDAVLDFVDDLIGASLGSADALSRLDRGRLTRELGVRDLTPAAIGLVRCVARAAVAYLGEGTALVGDDPLALAVADGFEQIVIPSDRSLRRRAVVIGVSVSDVVPRSRVVVRSLAGLDPAAALDRADEALLGLERDDIAVLLGPASALCDDLAGPLQSRRAGTLRVRNLIAALRLPRGMWRAAHRQSLGVWVCRGGAAEPSPWVADLAAGRLVLDDLEADVAGALARSGNRAYRYARRIDVARVLAAGALVPRGTRALRIRGLDAPAHLDRVHRATELTATTPDPLDVLVAPAPGRVELRRRSLGELQADGLVAVKRGSRIDAAHASADGTVVVLPEATLRLDPFDAARHYPRATRTEPGDVIVVEKPVPRAWVDPVGGALVASPARILRIDPRAVCGPHLLAAVINETAEAGSEWPTWSVPEMSPDEANRLEVVLLAIDRYERDLRRRSDAVHDLRQALIDGVAAGALTLDAQPTTPGIAGSTR
ncbi:hypothetical protein [Skermania piniformis]|uniref:Uncharacterized protein n=1 Tax=Skermania pinensis TaxID=39122 RepID=A0ABX8SFU6_9ACTN|nr:hypothetical protein [Skermania piniformis]QXQ14566.1 hypothetical protein KV203_03935 [Skermania piniformis]